MAGRWLAAAAAALAIAGAAATGAAQGRGPAWDEPCELGRVDRGRASSHRCIACHEQTADAVALSRGPRSHGNHPVEVDYRARAALRPDELVQATRLPPDVPLVDGKVACTSCHDGRSGRRGRVVDPEYLCTACHAM